MRQQILIYIEQEGETGYKELKTKFNVATGTLYHHLRFLKGLIEQNSSKKYFLTDEGRKALDVLFQEDVITNKPLNQSHHESLAEEASTTKSIDNIEETTIPAEQDIANVPEHKEPDSIQKEELNVEQILESPSIGSTFKVPTQTRAENYFNINQIIHSIPEWFYIINFFAFFILPVILFLIQPKVVFFHFIPLEISNSMFSFAMFIFPIFNFLILFMISIIKQERISIPTAGILVIYYNTIFILTIIFNIFNLLSNNTILHVFSILIQGLFIIFWTVSISLQYYSWERSLLLAILQNYILFLFF